MLVCGYEVLCGIKLNKNYGLQWVGIRIFAIKRL